MALRSLLVLRLILSFRFKPRSLISTCWLWIWKHWLRNVSLWRLLCDVLFIAWLSRVWGILNLLLQLFQHLLLFVDILSTLRTMSVLRWVLRLRWLLRIDEVLVLWAGDTHLSTLEAVYRFLEIIHAIQFRLVSCMMVALVCGKYWLTLTARIVVCQSVGHVIHRLICFLSVSGRDIDRVTLLRSFPFYSTQ